MILKEQDLSALVIAMWQKKGYCVHGEVTVYNRSATIDHVAHTGPCDAPEHIVCLELKTQMSQALMAQIGANDLGHYQDEQYAVTPHKRGYGAEHPVYKAWCDAEQGDAERTVRGRKTTGIFPLWTVPGWITFDPATGEVKELILPRQKTNTHQRRKKTVSTLGDPYLKQNAHRLLLVEQNKCKPGGVALGALERKVTHLSCLVDHLLQQLPTLIPGRLGVLHDSAALGVRTVVVRPTAHNRRRAPIRSEAAQAAAPVTRTVLYPRSKSILKAIARDLPKLTATQVAALIDSAPAFIKAYPNPKQAVGRAYKDMVRQMILDRLIEEAGG